MLNNNSSFSLIILIKIILKWGKGVQEETLAGNGYVFNLDSGNGVRDVHICLNSYIKYEEFFVYQLHFNKPIKKKDIRTINF